MNKENLLTRYLEAINNKEPLIINYGKGMLSDDEVKDYARWDNDKQAYVDDTGIWDTKLLIEIAKGEVENTKIEMESDY